VITMELDFALVDVFTGRPFGGNQLAVFPDATGIADETMQQLAREFNFSETTFVLPPASPSCTCRVRIFTPSRELPFAGHPTVGTAAVLARSPQGQTTAREFVFEEGIGPVPVTVSGETIRLRLPSPRCESSPEPPPATQIARTLALPPDAITDSWYAGVGLRFCFVRLASPELVDRAVLDRAAWAKHLAGTWSPDLYLFAITSSPGDSPTVIHGRFFAPAAGIGEDPATGSACAALAASIAQRSPDQDGTYLIQVDQGAAMGRPSRLVGTASKKGGQITEITVAGRATIIGHGTITLPPR
jgi:trans-2,3-dihydro-3-hydroxyanthranilate isomerase